MKKILMPACLLLTAALAACSGGSQKASTGNFEKVLNASLAESKMCLSLGLADTDNSVADLSKVALGDKEIRIPKKNADGDKINKTALKQMAVLVDAGLYEEGKESEMQAGSEEVPVAVFYRTDKGDKNTLAAPQGAQLCVGHEKVEKIVLYTEPTPADGMTVSKVSYDAKIVPEKWAEKLFKNSGDAVQKDWNAPRREHAVLVLTNQGWRDARGLQ